METRNLTSDTTIFSNFVEFPGFGYVPANSYLIKSHQPVLVDTNLFFERDNFLAALRSVIDPSNLQWLFLTHPHPDHTGSLMPLMNEVPHLRLVTTFMGYGLLSLTEQIPLDRLYLLNPGETLDVGDRQLAAIKPATFDDPSTTGFLDTKTRALFSSDSFGALVPGPVERAEDVERDALLHGQRMWTMMDSPWLHKVDQGKFSAELKSFAALEPSWILSSHLPPAAGTMTDTFVESLSTIPGMEPFVGPNQQALEAMIAQMSAPVQA